MRGRILDTVERTVAGLLEHHAFDHAAAMAFYFFLSLFPLLAFLGYVLARIAISAGLDAFAAPLYGLMPSSVATAVRDELAHMSDASGVAPVSLVVFVYLTSSGTHNAMDLLEIATGAAPRRWWHQRAIAIAWNVATVALLTFAAWLLFSLTNAPVVIALARDARDLAQRIIQISIDPAVGAVFLAVFFGISIVALALFFRIAVVHPPGVLRHVWPGAVSAVLLGALVSWGFGLYVRTLGRYTVYFGGLAAVAVVLMWLYLASLALLVGAEINAQLEGLRHYQPRLSKQIGWHRP